MTIWANTIVHNEENFIWYALMSVVDFVDKILIYDTGSSDKTVEAIKEVMKIKGEKIVLKEVGKQDDLKFTKMRQAMFDESDCDWILILDGDEVWWEDSIKGIKEEIEKHGNKLDSIAVPFYNLAGDIYHYQSQSAGQYKLLGKKGHLTIKAVNRKIPGLHWSGPYGKEGLYDGNGSLIQERQTGKLTFLELPFLHFTHLRRSSQVSGKFKYDLGVKFPKDFKYPEVLYKQRPQAVPSPWQPRGRKYELVSMGKYPYQVLWRAVKNKI